jgi:hypothetical protein
MQRISYDQGIGKETKGVSPDIPYFKLLWHADPLLGGDHEIGDRTAAVARLSYIYFNQKLGEGVHLVKTKRDKYVIKNRNYCFRRTI